MPIPERAPIRPPLSAASHEGGRWSEHTRPLPPARTGAETARHIAEAAASLAEVARVSRLDVLAYLLDIAQFEAERAAVRAGGDPA